MSNVIPRHELPKMSSQNLFGTSYSFRTFECLRIAIFWLFFLHNFTSLFSVVREFGIEHLNNV